MFSNLDVEVAAISMQALGVKQTPGAGVELLQVLGVERRIDNHETYSWYTGVSPFHSSGFRIDFDYMILCSTKYLGKQPS